jgi:hypothetical protein
MGARLCAHRHEQELYGGVAKPLTLQCPLIETANHFSRESVGLRVQNIPPRSETNGASISTSCETGNCSQFYETWFSLSNDAVKVGGIQVKNIGGVGPDEQ